MSDTALVLCAGFGTRLGSLVRDRPKALLPVGGRPLLAWMLRHLAGQGVRRVFVNLHYRGTMIRDAIGDGRRFGVSIRYLDEPEPLGTAGTVAALAPDLASLDALFVIYGDLLTDQPLDPLRAAHRHHRADATLLVHRRAGSNSRLLLDASHRITRFEERPGDGDASETWVNSGVQLLSRALISALPSVRPLDLPRDVYAPGAQDLHLQAVPLTGVRWAIDSPARLAAADAAARTWAW